MYADDTTLLCSSSNPVTLQQELDSNFKQISKWLDYNQLTLNVNKTKFMIFGTSHKLKFSKIFLLCIMGKTLKE